MNQFIRVLLLVICPLLLNAQELFSFEHNGVEREYLLHLPNQLSPEAPLVFVLHGYTSSAQTISNYCGMTNIADLHGFAVCYPQGLRDLTGTTHWNAHLTISNVDDIGFLSKLAIHLQELHQLNPAHTFTCGMSNGGFMSYTLACERPDVFKAIASVTGTMSGYDWNNCNPSNPVPVFQISGLEDNVVPFDGSITTFGGWGGAEGAIAVNDFWKNMNQTNELRTEELSANLVAEYSINTQNNKEVWFYPIMNYAHEWAGEWNRNRTGILASEEIWRFFSKIIDRSTSIDNSPRKEINIRPNPAHGFIKINGIKKGGDNMIRLYDLNGGLIMMKAVGSDLEMDLSRLKSGVYIIQINDSLHKIVKV